MCRGGCSSMVRALDCGSRGCGFESHHPPHFFGGRGHQGVTANLCSIGEARGRRRACRWKTFPRAERTSGEPAVRMTRISTAGTVGHRGMEPAPIVNHTRPGLCHLDRATYTTKVAPVGDPRILCSLKVSLKARGGYNSATGGYPIKRTITVTMTTVARMPKRPTSQESMRPGLTMSCLRHHRFALRRKDRTAHLPRRCHHEAPDGRYVYRQGSAPT